MPHIGVLYYCDLIQRLPLYLRRKALGVVAGKVALVARLDSYHNAKGVTDGAKFRSDLESKLEKMQGLYLITHTVIHTKASSHPPSFLPFFPTLSCILIHPHTHPPNTLFPPLEPDKARTKKALPIPEEKKRSKRGGRRVRKVGGSATVIQSYFI